MHCGKMYGATHKFLSVRVLCFACSDLVVLLKHFLQVLRSTANLFGQLGTSNFLHEATARVMPGVEIKDFRSLAVQDEPDGELVLKHLTRDVISMAELITESVTVSVQEKTTLATKSWD